MIGRYRDYPSHPLDPSNPGTWRIVLTHPNGEVQELPPNVDWVVSSRFGKTGSALALNVAGGVDHSRPYYRQAPYGQYPTVAMRDGEVVWGMIIQARPHSDIPEGFGLDPKEPVLYMTCPMGFDENAIIGATRKLIDENALREVDEELGKAEAEVIWRAPFGVNSSPSFETTIGQVALVMVKNLSSLVPPGFDPKEPIIGRIWISTAELKRLMATQVFETSGGRKAFLGFGAANSALLSCLCALETGLATVPEALVA